MKHIRQILALAIAVLLLASLAACGDSSSTSSTSTGASQPAAQTDGSQGTPPGEGGNRKLSIALETISPEANELREKYFTEPLQAAFPDDEIFVEVFADNQSLQVQVAGGSGPDIFHLNGPTDATEYAKAERVIDLSAYAEQYGWDEVFYDWAWGSSFYDGKLYSLPNSFEGMLIYYNTDVFEANSWEYPKTLEDFVAICDDAQSKGIIPIAFGNSDYQGAIDWLYSTFLSCYAGPEALKGALEGTVKWTAPEIRGAIELMVNWWQKGYISDKKSQALTMDDMNALFVDGQAAMMINGTWISTTLLNTYPDANWDSEVMPELRDGVGRVLPLATGGVYAVNATCANPDFAAEVLNWMFTEGIDAHITSVLEASYQPYPVKSIDEASLTGMNPKDQDMYGELFKGQASGNVGFCAWTFYPNEVRTYMNENTDALFLGSLSIDDYLAEVQTLVDNAVAEGAVPKLP